MKLGFKTTSYDKLLADVSKTLKRQLFDYLL